MRASAGDLPLRFAAGWADPPMVALWNVTEDGAADLATLQHGDPADPSAPTLLIAVTRGPAEALVSHLRHFNNPTAPTTPGSTQTGTVEVRLDGRAHTFGLWRSENRWLAATDLDDGHALALDGRALPPHGHHLHLVDDLEPHLAARRRWIDKHHGAR